MSRLLTGLPRRLIVSDLVKRWLPFYCSVRFPLDLLEPSTPLKVSTSFDSSSGEPTLPSPHHRFIVADCSFVRRILGASFVPCLAWSTCFFDKTSVGFANALVGGWGNLGKSFFQFSLSVFALSLPIADDPVSSSIGGGVTFVVMVALFESLVERGLTPSQSWRASFALVPVPILWTVAGLCLYFGTDHPAGESPSVPLASHSFVSRLTRLLFDRQMECSTHAPCDRNRSSSRTLRPPRRIGEGSRRTQDERESSSDYSCSSSRRGRTR